jgi:hypothetical protein
LQNTVLQVFGAAQAEQEAILQRAKMLRIEILMIGNKNSLHLTSRPAVECNMITAQKPI